MTTKFDRHPRKISRREMLRLTALTGAGLIAAGCAVPPPPQGAAPAAATAAPMAAPTAAPTTAGGDLVVGMAGDIQNLDPFLMAFVNYAHMETCYDPFIQLDNQLGEHPFVLEEWTPSEDGMSMTLKVRSGIKFHDGNTVTNEDVASTINRAIDPETGIHPFALAWRIGESAAARGDDIVEVSFKEPGAYIVAGMGITCLVNSRFFDVLKSQEGGSGPFKLREWMPGESLVLEKFADYWQEGKPYLDTVSYKMFADESALVAALEAGTIDMVFSFPWREYDRLKDQFNIVRGQDAANFYYMGLQTQRPPFDKKEVRQAMAHAIDKETICKNVLFGISTPISDPFPQWSPGHFPEFDNKYPYDLDKAKQLLTEAGYPDGIEFNVPEPTGFSELGQMAEILKDSLAQIGSTVNIEVMDPAEWYPKLHDGDYHAVFSFGGGSQWFPTRISGSYDLRVVENTVWPDGLPPEDYREGIRMADSSFDPQVQKEGFRLMVSSLMEECWDIPIAHRYTLFAMAKYVQGLEWGIYDQPRYHNVMVSK